MLPSSHPLRVAPRRHARLRRAFVGVVEHGAAMLGGRAFYRRAHLSKRALVARDEDVTIASLPRELDGLVIAHLSDLHGGPFLAKGGLADVVELVRARAPDLAVVTGDWITRTWSDALPLLDDLARIEARLGTFAVFGNHDYRGRLEGKIADAARERSIRFLRNEGVRVEARGERALVLVGLEDFEEARDVDLARARTALRDGDVEVVLAHNPLAARRIARKGCALVLSGHSHGSQVDWPFLRRLGPVHPGLRVELGATTVIVSRGLGVVGAPFRAGAPAEVVFVRLRRASEEATCRVP